jgi:leucyl aminopeptidase (aminopeptidase T)
MRKISALPLVLSLLLAPIRTAHGADTDASAAPDWSKLAQHMVRESLHLAPGERVILHYLPGHNPPLIAALRDEITLAGGIICAELTWPSEKMGKFLDGLSAPDKLKRVAAEDVVYRELFARSDVYIWLDTSSFDDLVPRRFEHLIAGSNVRAIHSHWFESPDAKEHAALWRIYERAIEIDPQQINAKLAPMEAKLRGSTVRLLSPAGSDLTFRIPETAWFHRNTGEASREKVAGARSVRDREEELPAGALRTTAIEDANGKLVATVFSSLKTDTATVTFRHGHIVKIESHGGGGDEFNKWYQGATGDRDKISELVIGTNPELAPILPSGFMPYFGYGAGIVRIAIGDNWESGGALRTGDQQDWWLFVTDGTLTANKNPLIEAGKID